MILFSTRFHNRYAKNLLSFTGLFKGQEALKIGISGQMSGSAVQTLEKSLCLRELRGENPLKNRRVMSPVRSFLGGAGSPSTLERAGTARSTL